MHLEAYTAQFKFKSKLRWKTPTLQWYEPYLKCSVATLASGYHLGQCRQRPPLPTTESSGGAVLF